MAKVCSKWFVNETEYNFPASPMSRPFAIQQLLLSHEEVGIQNRSQNKKNKQISLPTAIFIS